MVPRRFVAFVIVASLLAGCAVPAPTPAPSPAPTPVPTPPPTVAATIPIHVTFKGTVNCELGVSYSCGPSLSVLEPGADVPDSWQPPVTDPMWDPRGGGMEAVEGTHWTLLRGSPVTAAGRHLLVVSLTGSSDVPSYGPDGTIARDLLGRCTTEVDVAPDAQGLDIVVAFKPQPATTRATCTIDAGAG